MLFRICLDQRTTLRLIFGKTIEFEPLPWGLSTVAFEASSYNVIAAEFPHANP